MVTINVSLSESLQAFIEDQVIEKGYSTPSEFIGELVQEAQKRKARESVEALLEQGLQSEPKEMTQADWDELKRRVWERAGKRDGASSRLSGELAKLPASILMDHAAEELQAQPVQNDGHE